MADDTALQVRTELVGGQDFAAYIISEVYKVSGQDVLDLYAELVQLMEEIKTNYVPIDTGDLADSGYVTEPFLVGNHWTIAIGFSSEHGGYEYAVIQHERLDYYHSHGQAKYLEEPLIEWAASKGADV